MRKPSNFDAKLAHSIQLLQKAERFALMYSPDKGYFLAFSGGKDSQAIYHVAKMAGVKFEAHMHLTSVDPPEVIRFVRSQYPDVIMKKPIDSIYNIAIKKQIVPTMVMRWCCEVYKEGGGSGMATIIGIRHTESVKRSKRSEVEIRGRKFAGDIEGFEEWRSQKLEKMHKSDSACTGFEKYDPKTDTTTTCMSGKDSLLVSPIIDWTDDDVWFFLNEVVRVPHCELYDQGWNRIGCIGCPMAAKKYRALEEERWPHVKRNWMRVIHILRERKRDLGKQDSFLSDEEYYEWWQSKQSTREWLFNKRRQTTINFEEHEEEI